MESREPDGELTFKEAMLINNDFITLTKALEGTQCETDLGKKVKSRFLLFLEKNLTILENSVLERTDETIGNLKHLLHQK